MQSSNSYVLVIFGITGNLAQIKLIPALYDLAASGVLPSNFTLLGIGRAPLSQSDFKQYFADIVRTPTLHHKHPISEPVLSGLLNHINYLSADTQTPGSYEQINTFLDRQTGCQNRIYYLATYPSLYPQIFDQLQAHGLNDTKNGWVRVMIEKPLGSDLSTARELNRLLAKYYIEDQIYRLDHYLGKETLQNILTFRFGNGLFEPLMDKKYIDSIQITASENFGIGKRGSYYDPTGALIDVGQNHLLQMIAISTMAAPAEFSNPAVTRSRVQALTHLVPDPENIIFGQYAGYTSEPHVLPGSMTETFFAFKTELLLPRFSHVPIFVRAGKYLSQTVTEIAVIFKNSAPRIFSHLEHGNDPNVLIYRIQPNEGIVVRFLSKVSGPDFKLQESYMQYCYRAGTPQLPDAYERLLADAFRGDQTFFNDAPEVEAQWKFIDPLVAAKSIKPLHIYPRGSWGPPAAAELCDWLEPSTAFCTL